MIPANTIGGVKSRYDVFASDRDSHLERARTAALLTIPTLIPPANAGKETRYPTPYQGLGARGVNNLASKLLLALMPPNSPFFKLAVDDFTLEKLTQRKGAKAEVEKVLGKIERAIQTNMEAAAIRVPLFEALKHLIVAGNVLLFLTPAQKLRVFHLDKYVCKRDPDGNVIEIITKEVSTPLAIPQAIRLHCQIEIKEELNGNPEPVEIYTRIFRTPGNVWRTVQEINGIEVPGSEGSYPIDKSPWLALRLVAVDNEDYGRGFVEEYMGDLKSLEGLTKAIVVGSAAAAKVLFLVAPNATTRKEQLAEAPSGAFRAGNSTDVTVLQLEKFADFRIALETIDRLTQRLSYAFMLNSSVQRSGERVTAEEIRYMAGELEDALGGVYSILSQELQLPLVTRVMHELTRLERIPSLPEGVVNPTITTGLEALGRGHDLRKLQLLLEHLAPLGPEVIERYLNVGDYITRGATALGITTDGLVRTEKEVQQKQQADQMAALMERMGPQLAQMAGEQPQQ